MTGRAGRCMRLLDDKHHRSRTTRPGNTVLRPSATSAFNRPNLGESASVARDLLILSATSTTRRPRPSATRRHKVSARSQHTSISFPRAGRRSRSCSPAIFSKALLISSLSPLEGWGEDNDPCGVMAKRDKRSLCDAHDRNAPTMPMIQTAFRQM